MHFGRGRLFIKIFYHHSLNFYSRLRATFDRPENRKLPDLAGFLQNRVGCRDDGGIPGYAGGSAGALWSRPCGRGASDNGQGNQAEHHKEG